MRRRAEQVTRAVRATLDMADLSQAPRQLVVEIRECIRRIKLMGALGDIEAQAVVEDGERVLDKVRTWLGGAGR